MASVRWTNRGPGHPSADRHSARIVSKVILSEPSLSTGRCRMANRYKGHEEGGAAVSCPRARPPLQLAPGGRPEEERPLHQVERLLAVAKPHRLERGEHAVPVHGLILVASFVPDRLVCCGGPVDRYVAPRLEDGGDVPPLDDDDAVPVELVGDPEIAVLDDEDPRPLDLRALKPDPCERRGGVEIPTSAATRRPNP